VSKLAKFKIKCRFTAKILFECEAISMKAAVEKAIEVKANLRSADLSSADLSSADLSFADLRFANLSFADLSSADLSSANLRSADLSFANLRSADLRFANLSSADLRFADISSADLRFADLRFANLSSAKEDFFKVLSIAKNEIIGLYDALKRGKIDGSHYQGECACLVGTVANIRKEHHESLKIDLRPNSSRPAEIWFLGIRKGDTPESSIISKITQDWIEEFANKESIRLPKYKLVSSDQHAELFQEGES
jgi:hypothetical protein